MDVTSISSARAAASAATEKKDAKPAVGFAALFDKAKKTLKDGESLEKVEGHPYAKIEGGKRDDMFVNLTGNERSGRAFEKVVKNGRVLHVYGGDGGERVIIAFPKKPDAGDDAGGSPAS